MKTLKSILKFWLISVYSGLTLFALSACNDFYSEESPDNDSVNREYIQLNDVLSLLGYESQIIIVQSENSVQEAVDVADPGDMIFIEPAVYKEAIIVDKPGLKLIGACSTHDEQVILENPGITGKGIAVSQEQYRVELMNVRLDKFREESSCITEYKCSGNNRAGMLLGVTREELGNGIAHYQYDVRMGEGEYDVVRIHRVVRERHPYHPVHTKGDVFMVHGAPQDFDDIFLTAGAEVISARTSAPCYLAERNIDVWGVDLAWNFIPAETEDFSFMKGWGLEKDIDHTLKAMALARLIRGLTGQGFDRLNLLGFSYGVPVGYRAAARETQMHPVLRQVKGIISVDSHMKYDRDKYNDFRLIECENAEGFKALLSAGTYQSDMGKGLISMADLALSAPDALSPVPGFEGFTNKQAMILVGILPNDGYWHFFGGNLETIEMNFTDPGRFFRAVTNMAPYMPMQSLYELYACGCDEENVSIDDHLEEIKVPIFDLTASGGENEISAYTAVITASQDITHEIVTVPGYDISQNYGHADLWMGSDADNLVWAKLYDWLKDHSAR